MEDMKTYFYSIDKKFCGKSCSYQTCPLRYFSRLQLKARFKDIAPFNGTCGYHLAPLATRPRHGDIIILYAENRKDLEEMIVNKERFEGLRRILVVGEAEGIDSRIYHKLSPRYITRAGRSLGELESVINRMKLHAN